MEPIKYTKSNSDLNIKREQAPEYKSVYKSNLLHRRLGHIYKQFPKFSTIKELQNQIPLKPTLYRCVDEYVEMTMPNSSSCSSPQTPCAPVTSQEPLPSPRKCMEHVDYANINTINAHNKHDCHDTNSLMSDSFVSNSNNPTYNEIANAPTPDCSPPSASEAETAIYEFVKPHDKSLKRKNLLPRQQDSQLSQSEPQNEQLDNLSSSQVSECVEEYVGDVPFAGLFKGSSLNLAASSTSDLRALPANEEIPSGLRSPSLVKSVKPVANKENVSADTSTLENDYEFDAQKAWEEINTIFETIGNEVASKDDKLEDSSEQNLLKNTLRNKTLTIRKPAELLLSSSAQKHTSNPSWCHSTDTLIYGNVTYNVFYLGSTVIRDLHGTVSTRKSIQKLKREETPVFQEDCEDKALIEDMNSSTRILKQTNQHARLQVCIALSYTGVQFIEIDNKSILCVHDTTNINCVCQDSDDLRYFAYITREYDTHYCHVFMVDDVNLATEIILTLGQTFEIFYQLSKINQESDVESAQPEMEKRSSYVDVVDSI